MRRIFFRTGLILRGYKGSTNQKTGESMETPGKKLKKVFVILGTTGAVYAGFKYLLPLVAPFLLGYGAALFLRPSARFFSHRIHLTIRGKRRHLPVGAAGGAEFLLLLAIVGFLSFWGFGKLCQEARLLTGQLPLWIEALDQWLTQGCSALEETFGLKEGQAARTVTRLIRHMLERVKEGAAPALMENSMAAIRVGAQVVIVTVVTFLAAVLSLQEMDDLRERRDRSLFRSEFLLIGNRVVCTGKAWFKTQGVLLLVITAICILGMALIGNPYYIIAGIFIGLLDALPIFGTGTVLLPWSLICLFSGQWGKALVLTVLYLVCYLLREFLESHMMGGQVGLTPLETLASIYVGLQIFGFFGFILGPLGLLLVEDLVEEWERGQRKQASDSLTKQQFWRKIER